MAVNIKYRALNPVVHAETSVKGAPLTNEEIDGNFKNVKDAVEVIQSSGGAAAVGFTPTGTVAATNVQSAINEVVSDLAAGTGASLVGYTPAGTGAVATTVKSKLRETVSVKDFGAVGDGTTDDSAAVQLAVNYCLANGNDLVVPGLCRLGYSVNIDRLVDSAAADNYFTITTSNGGGFVVAGDVVMFSTTLVNGSDPNLPVSQMVRFDGLKFEADVSTRTAYVLNQNKFLRVLFESCNFSKIKALNAPAGKLTQSIYFQNCQMRRWSGQFFTSKEVTFDLKVLNCLVEAGGNGFDIDYPVGADFSGSTIEGMESYAVKYIGGYALNFNGCYFESNGGADPNGCSIDGSAGTGVDGSEAVSIVGCYFSGDGDTPTKPQVKWGDCVAGLSSGNLCTTTLHNFVSGSRVDVIGDYARTALANSNPKRFFRAHDQQTYGGVITQEFVGGRGGILKLRSLQNNVESSRGVTVSDDGNIGFGTDFPLAETHTYRASTSKPKNLLSNSTIGANYGGFFSGYGVTNQGGYASIGTMQNGVLAEAVIVNQFHSVYPAVDNTQSFGVGSLRWSVVYAGTGTINTSDEREKQDIAALDAAELRVAAAVKGLIKKFRFKDAVQVKGDGARIHIGMIAQEVMAAFQAERLDPMRYGVVCYDEWAAELDEEGNEIRPAGNRYGVRYEELLAFIIAAL